MHVIYTCIPETNYVPREYSAILLILFTVRISLVPVLNLLYFLHLYFPKYVCSAQYGCFFFVVPSLHVFLVCRSRIFSMTLK